MNCVNGGGRNNTPHFAKPRPLTESLQIHLFAIGMKKLAYVGRPAFITK